MPLADIRCDDSTVTFDPGSIFKNPGPPFGCISQILTSCESELYRLTKLQRRKPRNMVTTDFVFSTETAATPAAYVVYFALCEIENSAKHPQMQIYALAVGVNHQSIGVINVRNRNMWLHGAVVLDTLFVPPFDDMICFFKTLFDISDFDDSRCYVRGIFKKVACCSGPHYGRIRLHRFKHVKNRRLFLDIQIGFFKGPHSRVFVNCYHRCDGFALISDILRI